MMSSLIVNCWSNDPRFEHTSGLLALNLFKGLRGFGWKPLRKLGLQPEEIERLTTQAKLDLMDPSIHGFYNV